VKGLFGFKFGKIIIIKFQNYEIKKDYQNLISNLKNIISYYHYYFRIFEVLVIFITGVKKFLINIVFEFWYK